MNWAHLPVAVALQRLMLPLYTSLQLVVFWLILTLMRMKIVKLLLHYHLMPLIQLPILKMTTLDWYLPMMPHHQRFSQLLRHLIRQPTNFALMKWIQTQISQHQRMMLMAMLRYQHQTPQVMALLAVRFILILQPVIPTRSFVQPVSIFFRRVKTFYFVLVKHLN